MAAQNENQNIQDASLSDLEIVSPQLSQRILSATYNRHTQSEKPSSSLFHIAR